MKKIIFIILILILMNNFNKSFAEDLNTEIIGTVNGENLYLTDFNRLFNAQRHKTSNSNESEVDLKNKILSLLIDEMLILQEAKTKKINAKEEEITKRLNAIIEKQGGEENFKSFLAKNNATIEDAKNEIRKKTTYELVKKDIENQSTAEKKVSFKSFLTKKKLNSDIIVYTNKIFPESSPQVANEPIAKVVPDIRVNQYPTLTKTKAEEIKKLEEKTNNIIAELNEQSTDKIEEIILEEAMIALPAEIVASKPTAIKPTKTYKEDKPIKIKKPFFKPHKDNLKNFLAKVDNKLKSAEPTKALKEKVNKFKLARGEKKKFDKNLKIELESAMESNTQAVVPGKPIIVESVVKKEEQKPETTAQNVNIQPPSQDTLNGFKLENDSSKSIEKLRVLSKELEELRKKIDQRRVSVK